MNREINWEINLGNKQGKINWEIDREINREINLGNKQGNKLGKK